MKAFLEFLEGKKTYLTCGAVFALLFGKWQGWWTIPEDVYVGLLGVAMIFMRAGAKRDLDDRVPPSPPGQPPLPPPDAPPR